MHPPATTILSCSLELHLNTSCTPGTSYMPQSLESLTETSTSSCLCHDCSPEAFLISCFGFRLCRCLSFPGLLTFLPSFHTWGFFTSSLVYAPSSSQLLTITCLCQHNSLACFQPFTFILQHPCWRPSWSQLYLFLFSMWLLLTGQRSDLLLWMELISQISAFHATTCLSSCILSPALPLLQSVLLKDKQPQNCIGFPFAVSWNINYHFQAVCISFPG